MREFKPLPRSFYEPSADVVAVEMLGHWLVRRTSDGLCGGRIVETEAYLTGDPACHAAPGETNRNRVMFGPPGYAYVYFIYGAHYCVNAVCCAPGIAEAVLIRAVEPGLGCELMQRYRSTHKLQNLTNGPAKLCEAMAINRKLDGADLCDARGPLFIGQDPEVEQFRRSQGPVVTAVRVGITKAAELPLRFYLGGSAFVSRRAASGAPSRPD